MGQYRELTSGEVKKFFEADSKPASRKPKRAKARPARKAGGLKPGI
jgi:hypothetical protein